MTGQRRPKPRRHWEVFSLLCILLTAGAGAAQVPRAGSQLVVRANPCLYLRQAPSPQADRLSCLPTGRRVRLLESRERWGRVRLADGREGWLALDLVDTVVEGPAAARSPAATPPAATPPVATAGPGPGAGGAADDELRRELARVTAAYEVAIASAAELHADVAQLRGANEGLEDVAARLHEENLRLGAEAAARRDSGQRIESEAAELRAEAEALRAEAQAQRQEAEALRRETADLRARNQRLEAATAAQAEAAEAAGRRIAELEEYAEAAGRRIPELEESAAAAGQRIAELEAAAGAAETARARLEGERNARESEHAAALDEAAAAAQRQIDDLAGRLQAAEQFLAASEEQRRAFAKELAALRAEPAPEPAPVVEPAAAGAGQPEAAAPPPPAPGASAEILATVNSWAEAWSKQRVEDYLAFYATAFEPPDGLSRQRWETQRRQRLLAPSRINVGAALVDLRLPGPDRAEVEILQSYRSDRFTDVVVKTLELVVEAGRWKIVRESVE